ncbi:hypothetical protein NSK_002089 [Nannochloropsis salina CCMP1776]|uniref:Uncharacterized protein n=1 Tax=Nannochloropsis salina CCMP1776 TaxID=1027361 RepID=A0A4D9D4F8_9STRA|nr:hypothetical protein NSK_002089 [Nannochloropsis salina CCMP1776]|eukprot:TFJ86432.1 hypothetical protein NSK_002089 [Nannochloropsis salina CCMP1776]
MSAFRPRLARSFLPPLVLLGLGTGAASLLSPSPTSASSNLSSLEDDAVPPSLSSSPRRRQHDQACAHLLQHLSRFKAPPSFASSSPSSSRRRRRGGAATTRRYLQQTLPPSRERAGGREVLRAVECRDALGRSALAVAAMQGDEESVQVLIEDGYQVGAEDVHRLTPLSYAAWKGHAAVVELLLEGGADGGHFDDFGVTPLHKAAAFGHPRVVSMLLRGRVREGCEGEAPLEADLSTGPVLAPPHYEAQSLHQTPLHLALRPSPALDSAVRQELVLTLLAHGASVSAQDLNGDTALHAAARLGEAPLLWLLLVGATEEGQDREGRSVERGAERKKAWRITNAKGETPVECLAWWKLYLSLLFLMAGAWG